MAGRPPHPPVEHEPDAVPRVLSRGRAFVYVLACRNDNLFKMGFSRDPLVRWHTLHRRFFAFFSLEQGILVGPQRVNEARRLERQLLEAFSDYRALAPVLTHSAAGGDSEWFRGVMAEAVELARAVASRNAWEWQSPGDWLRHALLERRDLLFSWTAAMLESIEFETHNPSVGSEAMCARCERALLDTLDAFRAVGLDIDGRVPDRVQRWYRERRS